MRWKKKPVNTKTYPKEGDERVISGFLFFPECLNGEYRWLEFAQVLQVWAEDYCNHPYPIYKWCAVSWVEKETKNGPNT